MTTVGLRIKEIRDHYNLTQQQFANELGLKRNTIATYETTDKEPSNNVIIAICRIWNISEDWLRYGNGKMLMDMDKEGEIMAFIGKTFADDKPSFTKEFIHVLSKLSVEEWELLEKIANLIVEEKNS